MALCEGNPPATVDSPHKGQVMWSFTVSVVVILIDKCWSISRVAGDLRRHAAHAMSLKWWSYTPYIFISICVQQEAYKKINNNIQISTKMYYISIINAYLKINAYLTIVNFLFCIQS